MSKGIIYYTDNRLEGLGFEHMLPTLNRESILASGLPVISCSLKPMDFGNNIVLNKEPGVVTMYEQILTALENAKEDYVFFCEHDVIYHPSHFEFTPSQDETFYYNTNVWRCHLRSGVCVTYDKLRSVSGICVNREHAVGHYKKRIKYIYDKGFDKLSGRNPQWARSMGYEPGKPVKNGGFIDERMEDWRSRCPNIDIRHRLSITSHQMDIDHFKHKPVNFKKVKLEEVLEWNIRKIFKI